MIDNSIKYMFLIITKNLICTHYLISEKKQEKEEDTYNTLQFQAYVSLTIHLLTRGVKLDNKGDALVKRVKKYRLLPASV